MTDASMAAPFAESDFRVGRGLNRSASVLSRNFVVFFVIGAIAYLPVALAGAAFAAYFIVGAPIGPDMSFVPIIVFGLAFFLVFIALGVLSQAMIVNAAFQDMRRRPVSFVEAVKVGLRRFFPLIVLAIISALLGMIGLALLIFPAAIIATMLFVSTPACVVEHCGPFASMSRSSELTKGHRWKVFGVLVLLIAVSI